MEVMLGLEQGEKESVGACAPAAQSCRVPLEHQGPSPSCPFLLSSLFSSLLPSSFFIIFPALWAVLVNTCIVFRPNDFWSQFISFVLDKSFSDVQTASKNVHPAQLCSVRYLLAVSPRR